MPCSLDKNMPALYQERPWVFLYGSLLAGRAGYVNMVLLGSYHDPVSHMTGATSRIAIDLPAGDIEDLHWALAIFIGLLLGASVGGALIGGTQMLPGRRYGSAMTPEGTLQGPAFVPVHFGSMTGIPVAATACGLQNAMTSGGCGLLGGYNFATLGGFALRPVALGCFLAGAACFEWRRRHRDILPVDRWGYVPPKEKPEA